ncbi:dihydrofolate reductase family protein [Myxococcota bacterium]|nr:dihydrofolate reductase family protein [Myxococcota bacterium]
MFIATSLDGFIARTDGRLDWLDRANTRISNPDELGYPAFMETVDVLVMGRLTYETVLGFGGEWPYGDKRIVVLSSRPVEIAGQLAKTVSCSSETPSELLRRLGAEGARRIYLDGGVTIQRFLAAGLVDDLTITIIPVLLGEGRRLFSSLPGDVLLELTDARAFDGGFAQLRYQVTRA